MSKYTDQLTAVQLIDYIAKDYVELSHDKIRWQRDDFMMICRSWIEANLFFESERGVNAASLDDDF